MAREGLDSLHYPEIHGVNIREYQPGDEEGIRNLIRPIWDEIFDEEEKPSLEDIKDIEGNYEFFLVGEGEKEIVGTTGVKTYQKDVGQLARVYVKEEKRGDGLGEKFLEEAIDYCAERYEEVVLKTDPKMDSAGFYRKFDFETYDFKDGKIWMKKKL